MRYLLVLLLLVVGVGVTAQTDSLLQRVSWEEAGTGTILRLTTDGTFEYDYGPAARTRYLMGRYTLDPDDEELTLGVDYLIGKRRIHPRYRRERDFYLPYAIARLTDERLVLIDLLTREEKVFTARPDDAREDPAERRIPKPNFRKLELPDGW